MSPGESPCAIFVRTRCIRVRSAYTFPFSLRDGKSTKAINEVAIIAVCEVSLFPYSRLDSIQDALLLVVTTHLKPNYDSRIDAVQELLSTVNYIRNELRIAEGVTAEVLIVGDFNAVPSSNTVHAFKTNPSLTLRSVYSDEMATNDRELNNSVLSKEGLYTRWAAKVSAKGALSETKKCLDYCIYFTPMSKPSARERQAPTSS